MMKYHCLIIEEKNSIISQIQEALKDLPCETDKVKGAFEALGYLRLKKFDFLILDRDIALIDSAEMIRMITKIRNKIPIYIIVPHTVDCESILRENPLIYDCIFLPLKNEEIAKKVTNLLNYFEVQSRLNLLYKELNQDYGFNHIIGTCAKMRELFYNLKKIRNSSVTVFVSGESGTGKELIARQIHKSSSRADKPFVPINIAAVPETLLESELFGHEKGSFTGAFNTRIGRFEQAEGGTLFLDEIGEMSLSTQSKLLRILEEQEFERVGGNKTIKTDVRIITATNKNLEKEVEDGNFRRDLYYRIKVFPMELPTLSERREDIPLLAAHLLDKLSTKNGKYYMTVSREALDGLQLMNWPGNIRELENVLERAVLISNSNNLIPEDFVFTGHEKSIVEEKSDKINIDTDSDTIHPMEYWEKIIIEHALRTLDWNVTKAAKELNLGRATLHRKIIKYNLMNSNNNIEIDEF